MLESRIRDLLRLYIRNQAAQEEHAQLPDQHLKTLKKIEAYIEVHLDGDCSVTRLAQVGNVSRSSLQRICHKHYRKGMHAVVTEKRMQEASRLLLNTDKSVSEIASIVSDMTFASFSSAFHDYFQQSPSSFRRNRGQLPKK